MIAKNRGHRIASGRRRFLSPWWLIPISTLGIVSYVLSQMFFSFPGHHQDQKFTPADPPPTGRNVTVTYEIGGSGFKNVVSYIPIDGSPTPTDRPFSLPWSITESGPSTNEPGFNSLRVSAVSYTFANDLTCTITLDGVVVDHESGHDSDGGQGVQCNATFTQ